MPSSRKKAKFLDSQNLISEERPRARTVEELGAAAQVEYAALLGVERGVTARYFRMGEILRLARKQLKHGQWLAYLKKWEIDKTRAAKAMRIAETFSTAAETAGLTVAEAYQRRVKRPRAKTAPYVPEEIVANPLESRGFTAGSWKQFADTIAATVERQLDEPEFLTPTEAATALAAVSRAVNILRQLEERLRHRTAGLDGGAGLDAIPMPTSPVN